MRRKTIQLALKRCIDVVASALGLLLVSPVQSVVAVLILIKMGRPVLFRQVRPGLDEKPFTLYKFRTMMDARGRDGKPLPDGERLTKLGRFLRRWSLDELPQLLNVLRGEMSLVGPRPLLIEYLELYTPRQSRRHKIRPGITGWAQVKGRNLLSWEEKFELDVWYADYWSLWLDARILALTLWNVLKGEGIAEADGHTMRKFTGSGGARVPRDGTTG